MTRNNLIREFLIIVVAFVVGILLPHAEMPWQITLLSVTFAALVMWIIAGPRHL